MTSGYSFGYVAGGDLKVVRESAERVVTSARDILDRAGLLSPPNSGRRRDAAPRTMPEKEDAVIRCPAQLLDAMRRWEWSL